VTARRSRRRAGEATRTSANPYERRPIVLPHVRRTRARHRRAAPAAHSREATRLRLHRVGAMMSRWRRAPWHLAVPTAAPLKGVPTAITDGRQSSNDQSPLENEHCRAEHLARSLFP
jgi:hypothetical protein